MSNKRHHAEWLSLLEISGPFVSLPVLEKVFPQGLDAHDPEHARRMRLAFDEWETNQTGQKPSPAIHNAWIQFVLKETLALPDEVLASGQSIPQTLKATHSEAGENIRPDYVVRNPEVIPDAGKPRLLIQVYPADQHLEKHVHGLRWKASPADRMAELLKQTKSPLGLVTNGEHWILANKTDELPTGFTSWYSSLWLEEPITLRAFRSLLGSSRFFGAQPGQTLEEMLTESVTHQQEVTDQLGLQVRRAVEVLIQSLDRADQDHGRKLLGDIPETVLYEAALTVMMRLVFLFCAEERELLLLGDPLYDQHYAVSTLVAQLQETADNHGEEILERRLDAWSRLLSTFRAVYGGVQHERMKLPAYAGNLFDPDRFPFLEGRPSASTRPASGRAVGGEGSSWRNTAANPLPVNNRTVLHLLRSLQYLQTHGEAQRISFRALGIEQIGHVYEGLLDHTAKRAAEPVLGQSGTKGKEPEIALSELEKQRAKSEDELVKFLKEETGRSESAIKNSLGVELEGEEAGRLRAACANDKSLYDRVIPFTALIANDSFDRPVVIRKGSVYVTTGTDRRTSGTHYTPTSLTEPIVKHTLEPLCYVGPAEGKPEDQWQLRSARELVDLKVCDMACGSGAFLVQACRYLSELLVEAWEQAESFLPPLSKGGQEGVVRITPYGEPSTGAAAEQLIPRDTEERLTYARRLGAQRCLYGVDKNPLAVEMAKLSLWLLTLAKDKPFTFLDHAIRPGDSLVGISSIEQLLRFSLSGSEEVRPAFTKELKQIENRLNAVTLLRKQIEEQPSNTPQDIERKAAMLKNAEEQTRRLTYAADLLLAASWQPMTASEREAALNSTLVEVEYKFKDVPVEQLDAEANKRLCKVGVDGRFHWPLEFPEVFERDGFDAFVSNPPFMHGSWISSRFGDGYASHIRTNAPTISGKVDYVIYFLHRSATLITAERSALGLILTAKANQGDARKSGFQALLDSGYAIIDARADLPWPGSASVLVCHVNLFRGKWKGSTYNSYLQKANADDLANVVAHSLAVNEGAVYLGAKPDSLGFVLTPEDAEPFLKQSRYRSILRPYYSGSDLNALAVLVPPRYIIDFSETDLEAARQFPELLRIVELEVKPKRLTLKRQSYRERWWQFTEPQLELFRAIRSGDTALAVGRVSKYFTIRFVPTDAVYSDKVVVFVRSSLADFAVLSSSLHSCWALEWGTTHGQGTPNYKPTECGRTFPFPCEDSAAGRRLEGTGRTLNEYRNGLFEKIEAGPTDTYNRFHDSDETAADIQKLRDLHVEMDQAVDAYGWYDLHLGHGFHETKQGVRYTISEPARREVLQRLLKLNHERYAEEVKQGLHEKKGKKRGDGRRARGGKEQPVGLTLFGDDEGG